ncbi:MAG: glucose-6-phosphate dehydrogenase [bacterium]|nr:glucose-6-phosphate dehydrogenase [bacterium]
MNSPFIMVVFGATGDLMRRKLLPSLLRLYNEGKFPQKFFIFGFARREFSNEQFRELLKEHMEFGSPDGLEKWENFTQNVYYQQGFFDEEKGYLDLIKKLEGFDKELGACLTRFFYLATPPQNYGAILDFLKSTSLSEGCGHQGKQWTKIIIEKPFGKDLKTARLLDSKLAEIFEEKQIFRVDHYLAKETVQNMIAFRFANGIFDPIWNKNYIDHVQITWAEKKGIGRRGKFFDGVGMLRDVGQNHLMQLIAAVAMEQPKSFSKEDVRDARASAIKAIKQIEPSQVSDFVVRGHYKGYTEEKDVSPSSETETYVAMKLFINTDRFLDVPFYLRAGKNMPTDTVEISIVFKQKCHILFKEFGCPEYGNVLTIKVQPNEGIKIRIITKLPGAKLSLGTADMKFTYKEEFGSGGTEAYEKLLLEIFEGDQMLFNRSDELESSWIFIEKIIEGWSGKAGSRGCLSNYEPQTWGPKQAFDLIEKDGRKWLV